MLSEAITITEADFLADQAQALSGNLTTNPAVSVSRSKDGVLHILSRYHDDEWQLPSTLFPENIRENQRILKFQNSPLVFHQIAKAVIHRYMMKGLAGVARPQGASIRNLLHNLQPFLVYLSQLGIDRLAAVTTLLTANYVKHAKESPAKNGKNKGKPLGSGTLLIRFNAVEILHWLSKDTADPMAHPWPESSAHLLSGSYKQPRFKAKTKIIPYNVLAPLFQAAETQIAKSENLLRWRDQVAYLREIEINKYYQKAANTYLKEKDYGGTLLEFTNELTDLRDSCLIIILTTSGIRSHELASLKSGMHRKVKDDDATYYWMGGRSDKTYAGDTEWLVCEVTHNAIKVLEELSAPLRESLRQQHLDVPHGPEAVEAEPHQNGLLLAECPRKGRQIRTLSGLAVINAINRFAQRNGLIGWDFTNHQFRRTFATYAASSPYGGLRFLKEHFKHWSWDMSMLYALNENADRELIDMILDARNEKETDIFQHMLESEVPLVGGEVAQVINTLRGKVKTFSSNRELAEKLHKQLSLLPVLFGWCTRDTGACSNGLGNPTKCLDCSNVVIDDTKMTLMLERYKQLLELRGTEVLSEPVQMRIDKQVRLFESILKEMNVEMDKVKSMDVLIGSDKITEEML